MCSPPLENTILFKDIHGATWFTAAKILALHGIVRKKNNKKKNNKKQALM